MHMIIHVSIVHFCTFPPPLGTQDPIVSVYWEGLPAVPTGTDCIAGLAAPTNGTDCIAALSTGMDCIAGLTAPANGMDCIAALSTGMDCISALATPVTGRDAESSLPVAHPGYQVLSDILFRLGLIANALTQCSA